MDIGRSWRNVSGDIPGVDPGRRRSPGSRITKWCRFPGERRFLLHHKCLDEVGVDFGVVFLPVVAYGDGLVFCGDA